MSRMSQQIREQLSALMDGELPRDETQFLLRRVAHERGLATCWSSYHVGRQVLRRQAFGLLDEAFTDAVLARIEGETLLDRRHGRGWLQWATGGAIAASVAVAALVLSGPPSDGGAAPGDSLVSRPTPTAQPSVPVAIRNNDFRPPLVAPTLDVQPASVSTAGFNAQPQPIDPRLQSYLLRHYDAAGNSGQSGLMPYVLLIVPSQQQATSGVAADKAPEQR
jgi:sigma-E factor negative regulatory protein RseA